MSWARTPPAFAGESRKMRWAMRWTGDGVRVDESANSCSVCAPASLIPAVLRFVALRRGWRVFAELRGTEGMITQVWKMAIPSNRLSAVLPVEKDCRYRVPINWLDSSNRPEFKD